MKHFQKVNSLDEKYLITYYFLLGTSIFSRTYLLVFFMLKFHLITIPTEESRAEVSWVRKKRAYRDILFRGEICVISTCSTNAMLGNIKFNAIIRYIMIRGEKKALEEEVRFYFLFFLSHLSSSAKNAMETVLMARR